MVAPRGHREKGKGMHRMTRMQEGTGLGTTPPLGVSGKTMEKATHRLCWSFHEKTVRSDCGCSFKIVRYLPSNFSYFNKHNKLS